ncbi:MAG TPA: hydroxymethylglutaryl-CoA synthase [bacterium]|nr:hydroxymethylglutaryl-CoA synthase [bacterium]HPN44479.1 hydroxymethylglutaryl-CoA synthase [bacterium]
MKAGIEAISFYTSHYFFDLKNLAEERQTPVDKFYHGIGQEKMAAPPPDEDVVTLAANAAYQVIQKVDAEKIDTVIFATESGIDQSKSAGIYVHSMLGLSRNCRVLEVKQACYSAAAGIQLALPYLLLHPDRKVLLVAADIARYGLGSAGEPTQGAGAVAMVLSSQPKIIAFDQETGIYTEDVMDFWRPNYREEAFVDGKFSIKMYLKSLYEAWQQYTDRSGSRFDDFYRFCYHLPFSRMGEKAHFHLAKHIGREDFSEEYLLGQINETLQYIKIIGNTYAASMYIGLMALLENSAQDLAGKKIGFFSYGSGCVGEFFSGQVLPGYQQYLLAEQHRAFLQNRTELNYEEYKKFYLYSIPQDGGEYLTPRNKTGLFRFAGLKEHKRIYQKLESDSAR